MCNKNRVGDVTVINDSPYQTRLVLDGDDDNGVMVIRNGDTYTTYRYRQSALNVPHRVGTRQPMTYIYSRTMEKVHVSRETFFEYLIHLCRKDAWKIFDLVNNNYKCDRR